MCNNVDMFLIFEIVMPECSTGKSIAAWEREQNEHWHLHLEGRATNWCCSIVKV